MHVSSQARWPLLQANKAFAAGLHPTRRLHSRLRPTSLTTSAPTPHAPRAQPSNPMMSTTLAQTPGCRCCCSYNCNKAHTQESSRLCEVQ